nr:protein ZGRF1 isoform X1 [Pogona vitticeps]XP_020657791.1 protein ZGRF1 isoform X1 [Pogona vitticeps]XP_020657792.1 protein ZGRF1 isoform X1 [Pogona vitticeps]XP_020657793.1 protein ZGRF1 isoform X1 [Pogona vitticeps]
MACQEFTVLYTHQKTKKSKVWQDGILKATVGGNKAVLFDEKGQILDNIFVKFQIKPGDDLECERYLITIEGEKVSGMGSSDQQKVTEREVLRRNNLKSFASSSFHQPVGLKRKYTGFRVPRQMPKKMIMEESSSVVSPTPEDIHSVFPSQFYNSCPLFSAPCKKKENVCQLPIIEDVCMKKTDSVPVLASIPYADEYKVVQREAHSTNSADDTCLKLEFHVDDGRISSDCQKSTDKAVSQNVRSKAQILALLSKEHKDFNTSPVGNTVSVKNLALASVKLDSHQEGLSLSEPPRTTDSLLREKTKCLLGSTNNTIQENTEYSKLFFSSKRNVQTKSQWDAYLSSCFAEESSNIDDAENKNASDLQAVLKDKENNTIRSQQNKNQRTIPQVSSLEINMSPISKHSVKHQQHSFISPDSINNKNSDTEITSSFDHINYLDCISASKILEDELSKSSKHMMCDNLAKSGNESPNESYPVGSQCFSNASVCGDLGDPNKQLTEVNFNLLETVDLSDTEDEEFHVSNMLSQGSKSFEEDTGIQLEVSVETNHNAKIYNNGKKDNVQPASQQDRDMNYFSRSQPLQLCDEFPEKSNKMENGSVLPFIKELQHSQALAVGEKGDTNAAIYQNVYDDKAVLCTGLLREEDVSCKMNRRTDLTKMSMLPHVSHTSSICFVAKNNEKDMEIQEDDSQPSSRGICDNMKSVNPLAISSDDVSSDGVSQYVSQEYYSVPAENHKLDFRSNNYSLNCQTSDKLQIGKNKLADSVNICSFNKSDENKKDNFVCIKPSVNSLIHTSLTDGFRLLNSLTEHRTALESLQTIEESTGILPEKERRRKKLESVGTEAKRRFAKVTSEEMQTSFLYSGSPKLNSSLSSDVAEPTTATINRLHDHSDYKEPDSPLELELIPDQCPEDCEPTGSSCRQVEFHGYQLKGSAASETMTRESSLCVSLEPSIDMAESEITAKDSSFSSAQELSSPVLSGFFKPLGLSDISEHVSNISTVNREFDLIEEQDNEFFTFSESSNLSNKIMTNSPSNLILDFTPCASRELNKILSLPWISSQLSGYHFSPSQSNKKTAIDMHEEEFQPLGIVPNLPMDDSKSFFKESSCPKSDLLRHLPTPRMRTPVVTVPVNEELADSDVCCSIMTSEQVQQPLDLSEVTISDSLKTLRPEDRMHETFVADNGIGDRQGVPIRSAFPNVSEQKRPSKWQKYQNTTCSDLRTENSNEVAMTSDIRAESFLGMALDDIGESWAHATGNSLPGSVHLQTKESMLCKQSQNLSSQDSVSEGRKLSLHLNNKFCTEEAPKVLGQLNRHSVTRHIKNPSELLFPGAEMVECATVPKRQIHIPAEFQSPAHYKQVFTSALIEHLNILLFELSQKLHKALEKVDISFYTSMKGQEQKKSSPLCNHKIPTKVVMVKKEGRNKGRFFYACEAPKADRCDFFKWVEDVQSGQVLQCRPSVAFHDVKSIGTYLRGQKIPLYEECQLLMRKAFDIQRRQFGKLKKCNIAKTNYDCESKSRLYLKLNRKESSSVYSKDDLWVVSKTLTFEPLDTFIACSVFFGPSSTNEVELEPLKGYSPSNWCSNMIVHALLVCNASAELTTLRNIEENFSSATLPIMQHLLTKNFKDVSSSDRVNKQKFKPPALNTTTVISGILSPEIIMNLANKMIETFQLNKDQATALIQIGAMMASQNVNTEVGKHHVLPITIIHGVFGSGKSYLLAVVILFLVQIFETSEATNGKISVPWKVLISSSTNVAVDRVLLCLLDLGFEEFIRVGSIRKIAKSILPHSLHAGSGSENEQVKELLALMKEDLTPAEKVYVRKTIEHHKLGTNKALLQQVRVVGATCAACPFPCMKNLKFPIVILDECSQMTEPASLLPIARFGCEKLILVGDSKQLPPTIQGSESTHSHGLEQTLFDRLGLMGHEPILLRTQYRCHPAISAIASDLFYEGKLLNGISEMDRTPLMEWLPTLCFYNVNGLEQMERDNSFHNMAEASFSVKLIEALIASGAEGSMIGVITLYKSQMSKICNLLGAINSDTFQIKAVQVSTVDAFQGAEKEIIILSCVRTKQVGFIDSEKRMNVALTRGKRHLLIVGNLNCLRKNKLWGSVIQHCSERKNGLQHVGECEQLLSDIIKSCLQRKKEEEINRPKV